LAATAEDEKKKAEGLQNLYDSERAELAELKKTHSNLVTEHNTYCDEVELHVGHVC
jgi:hypothetical protein